MKRNLYINRYLLTNNLFRPKNMKDYEKFIFLKWKLSKKIRYEKCIVKKKENSKELNNLLNKIIDS